ncbi:MAG: hypothetical protein M5U22_07230 [Thermoleophilia bacterium]|nr:hypothetical protein [Thermoleophilia bacterium]
MGIPQTESELREWLTEVIYSALDEESGGSPAHMRIDSFAEAQIMTLNEGLVLRFWNGPEFQLTIVKSR